MKKLLSALLIASIAPLSSTAAAADRNLSLTYVDASYQDIDGVADGFRLRGSYGFGESNWYAFADYSRSEIDELNNADFNMGHIGVGYSLPISEPADLVFETGYQLIRADGSDLSGYRIAAGVRTQLGTPRLEGHAKAVRYGGGDLESQWGANIGLNYFFTDAKRFSVLGEYEYGEDGDIYWVGLRATF